MVHLLRISIAAALVLAAAAPGHAGLIHHYTFDGNVDDQAGSANGTLVGDASAAGGVLTLDGSGDWVTFSSYLVPTGGADFSVAFFAKFVYSGGIHEFLSQGGSGSGFYIGNYYNELRITDNYYWAGTPPFSGDCGGCGGVATPQDGGWHHYALVIDGSNAEFFIDGVSRATRPGFAIGAGGATTVFGSQFGGGWEQFNGSLKDVRIYDNTLTAAQVGTLANPESSPVPEPGTFALLGGTLLVAAAFARRGR